MSTYTRNQVLGRYRLLRRLGAGGMATVFLARDERLGRQVALKRLHADSPEDLARRFEREARVGASLNHPNIVTVYDTGTDAEGLVVVMEYVEGETLSRVLRRGPLAPDRAVTVVRDVAAALDHAHRNGVVHRDVKPANVLLRKDGTVKLADLGIAHAAEQTRLTATGSVFGTASYMAPEQLRGGRVCPETDVYALAAVAFEALSGRRAREGATPVEVAHKVSSGPPPDLRAVWSEAPPAAADVLARGMAFDTKERPDSAGELAEELSTAVLDGLERRRTEEPTAPLAPTAPPPPSAPAAPRTAPAPARHDFGGSKRGRAPAWAALALAALAVAAVVTVLMLGGGSESPPADERARNATQAPSGGGAAGGGVSDGDAGADASAVAGGDENALEEPVSTESGVPAPYPDADLEEGVALNDEGKSLIDQGNPQEAVPVLEQAVRNFPEESRTSDINYAYALFNYGQALRLSGQPEAAIPVLNARLQIPDQQDVVQAELEKAQAAAGQ